ncbi:uncharacterized protein LOC144792149 [Lissotriton helveticus]
MAKMITERLDFIRRNQTQLRAENYINLKDALNQDQHLHASDIGQHVILPATFTGSPRYMHEKTQDAMTYVRHSERPDLFLTFTCNPEWPEIKEELFPKQRSCDRQDIIARVFNLKVKARMKILTQKHIFGYAKVNIFTIEWQKTGLPHVHILLWLEPKIQADEVVLIISAELPDPVNDEQLFLIVKKNMLHGLCGEHNVLSPCMKNGICTKKYPRPLTNETETGVNGYPIYRRRSPQHGGQTITMTVRGQEITVDNQWVVPYSPVLCCTFNAHINIEYCQSVKAIKYICKYINKGSDQATATIANKHNEIETYLNGRYISTSEAVWRIIQFNIHERHPTVTHLAVHRPNGQRVYFNEKTMNRVAETPTPTTLTAFFKLYATDTFAKTLLYQEVPQYYTWGKHTFTRRKCGIDVLGHPGVKKDSALGRMYTIHPKQYECFHLRILLQHVRGPTSFESLLTVHGQLMPTYQSACKSLGLIEDDQHWKHTLSDAALSDCPNQLRQLFVTILIFCNPSDPMSLWEEYKEHLCEDILHRKQQETHDDSIPFTNDIFNQGLIAIEDSLYELNEKSLKDFKLPDSYRTIHNTNKHTQILPLNYNIHQYVEQHLPNLVPDENVAYNTIVQSVESKEGKIFFLDAPGGTGKTYLINLILAKIRSSGLLALAVASSGIAATLLTGGKTAHSTFKLPLNVSVEKESTCSVRKNGPLGTLLQRVSLIVWDECTMTHRAHIDTVNRTLQDIRNVNTIMGGVTFVFAGDFRQTLPVVPTGTRADILKACLKASQLWDCV